jgi:hypothetical protein
MGKGLCFIADQNFLRRLPMAKNDQKTNKGQPPKINLNGTENDAPAKAPPAARPFIPSKMKADSDALKKETTRIDPSSAASSFEGAAPHAKDDLKRSTTRLDRNSGIAPISDEEKREAARKSTIRIDTSEIMPPPEDNKSETSKKSTVRVQIDEDLAKGDTARLDAKSIAEAEESTKKRTARIDLNEVLDESDDIFKRRTALMNASKLSGLTEAPGIPQTVRIKRPETPMTTAPRKSAPIPGEEASVTAATVKESDTSRKSETARIDLPPEATEQPPTRRKTIRIKRPEGIVISRPLVIGGAKSVAGPSGPTAIPKEEEAGALFSVMALVAILIGIALITFQSLTLRSFLQF